MHENPMLLKKRISLFSPRTISERHHRSLLIQFILFELFEAYRAYCRKENWENILSFHPRHFPYDWSAVTGYLNKAQEHSILLKDSFPDHSRLVKHFEGQFSKILASLSKKKKIPQDQFVKSLQTIYFAFEPFIKTCKDNENLLHFLLKHRETIDALMHQGYLYAYLLKIHPCDLETLGEKMCDQYHQRGFFSQIPEFKILLTELAHA
jgi:hypothetical protein